MNRYMRAGSLWCVFAAALLTLCVRIEVQADGAGIAVRTQGDARYISGGVGLTERQVLSEIAARETMNLKLVFAEWKGAFLASVPVTLTDASGVVRLRITSDGPWLFVRLPAGEYKYRAERGGMILTGTVAVPETGRAERVISFP